MTQTNMTLEELVAKVATLETEIISLRANMLQKNMDELEKKMNK